MMNVPAEIDVLISEEEISARVESMGQEIRARANGQTLVAVCVLKGSMVFFADLVRAIGTDVRFEYLAVRSYGSGTVSSGTVDIVADLREDIQGKDVLVVEDIVDSGRTLRRILSLLEARGPRSLRVAALLDKKSRREVDVPIDHVGFEISDDFVVGYGLDFDQKYRSLPFVGVVPSEAVFGESRSK